jgi:tetratricopeptide (TPR) repeat protein
MKCMPRLVVVLAGVLALTVPLRAIYMAMETSQVPIERLATNLERERQADPKNAERLVNLARLYAMGYALKIPDVPATNRTPNQVEQPFYGHEEVRVPARVEKALTPADEATARQLLKKSIGYYEQALKLDPQNLTARLGHAWTLQQAGQKDAAIAGYRQVIAQAWTTEEKATRGMLGRRFFTEEAAGYLIPLLDPAKDKAEIADLQARRDKQRAMPRPITPIAVPLADEVALSAIVDPLARVRFDADGSGLGREWTWITPNAGWLVYDATDRGSIRSALQLFGSVTYWLFWKNGYHALAALDDNGDGELRGQELVHMGLWIDGDRDGVSDEGEVRPLAAHGIVALSCAYLEGDGWRVAASSPAGATFADGRTRPTYDVILRSVAPRMTTTDNTDNTDTERIATDNTENTESWANTDNTEVRK